MRTSSSYAAASPRLAWVTSAASSSGRLTTWPCTPPERRRFPPRAPGYARHVGDRWQSVRLDEIEPIPVAGGLLWRPLRRTLGVGAFGINAYVARSAGDDVVESHTESQLQHEEIYLVVA